MAAVERLQVLKGHLTASCSSNVNSSKYRFTLDNSVLSEDQRSFYETNGYLVIKNLVPHELLDEFRQRFGDICNGKVDRGRMTLVKDISLLKQGVTEGERLVYKLQDFQWDDVLFRYCSLPEIVRITKCFTGPNSMAINAMLINKPPDAGTQTTRHPLHQDLHYFPFRPADRIVCSWTAMEKVTRDNGCLVVLPGTHAGTLLPHEYPKWENGVNVGYHGVIGCDGQNRVHLRMEKGDTVFFHPVLIHGSGANRTQGSRKAISCHYAASECNYIDVKGTTQDVIAIELEELAKKRGFPITFQEYWKYRNRLLSGVAINL